MAPLPFSWGESVLGMRIARELVQRGYGVTFAVHPSLSSVVKDPQVHPVLLPEHHQDLPNLLPQIVARSKSKALVLVDMAAWTRVLGGDPAAAGFLRRLGIPVIGLDPWDLEALGFSWQLEGKTRTAVEVIRPTARLLPVPFLRPSRRQWTYDALVRLAPTSRSARRDARAALGVGGRDRLVVLTSSPWQSPKWYGGHQARIARLLPGLVGHMVARAGHRVRLLHIGPAPFAAFRAILGGRYRWSGQLPPDRFEQMLRAADLLLSLNASGTPAGTAVAMGLPVLTGINSLTIDSVERGLEVLPAPTRFLEAWLRKAIPMFPFAMWPFGYAWGMGRILARNPYRQLINLVEVLDEAAFVDRLRALLDDQGERQATIEAQDRYRQRVRKLPSAADLMARILEQ